MRFQCQQCLAHRGDLPARTQMSECGQQQFVG
ncbi:MAG: hypothetical protein QOH05_2625, partial [Acetobacteraceae bacterium]|nr:hypothetical protein [Acetobacteraceae bacterium]